MCMMQARRSAMRHVPGFDQGWRRYKYTSGLSVVVAAASYAAWRGRREESAIVLGLP